MPFALQAPYLLGMSLAARRQSDAPTRRDHTVPWQTQRAWRLRQGPSYPARPARHARTGRNTAIRSHFPMRDSGNGGVDALQGFHGAQFTASAKLTVDPASLPAPNR